MILARTLHEHMHNMRLQCLGSSLSSLMGSLWGNVAIQHSFISSKLKVCRTMPRNLYYCKCRCGCQKKPGCRRVECHCCGHLVGPGCCLTEEDVRGITLCHLCFDSSLERAKILYDRWDFGQTLVNDVFLILVYAYEMKHASNPAAKK